MAEYREDETTYWEDIRRWWRKPVSIKINFWQFLLIMLGPGLLVVAIIELTK